MKTAGWATAGSVLSAAVSSACCWLPLLLVGTGLSAVGAATFIEKFRPLFLAAAILFLGIAFFLNYRPERIECATDGTCTVPNRGLRRLNRIMLWISAVAVALFALLPNYVGCLIGIASTSGAREDSRGALNQDGSASTSDTSHVDPKAVSLAGHWVAEVVMTDGARVGLVIDLDRLDTRWVGEFDLEEFGVENYPVDVDLSSPHVRLHFAGPDADFEGTLAEDRSVLSGSLRFGDDNLVTIFERTGEPQFSDMFLALEAAADDSSRVALLSDSGLEFRQQFNSDKEKTRLVMLLSPT